MSVILPQMYLVNNHNNNKNYNNRKIIVSKKKKCNANKIRKQTNKQVFTSNYFDFGLRIENWNLSTTSDSASSPSERRSSRRWRLPTLSGGRVQACRGCCRTWTETPEPANNQKKSFISDFLAACVVYSLLWLLLFALCSRPNFCHLTAD